MPAIVATFACAASSIPMGAWLVATSRWPSWMRGPLKWPLGDEITPRVVVLYGWANVLVGVASLALVGLLLEFPSLLASNDPSARTAIGLALAVAVALVFGGSVLYVLSLRMSRRAG